MVNELAHEIDGHLYLTVRDFARIINRSEPTVRRLMSTGNRYRRLKVLHVAGKPFILANEVYTYPFTLSGRNFRDVFNYTDDGTGKLIITRATGYCASDSAKCDGDCENCIFYKELT